MNSIIRKQLRELEVSEPTIHNLELIPAPILKHGLYNAFGIGRRDSYNRTVVVNRYRKSFQCQLASLLCGRNPEFICLERYTPEAKHHTEHVIITYKPI